MIQISKPSIGEAELARVKEVFDSAWLGQGSVVAAFEERVKQCLGARHVVAVNTGTSALHVALDALGIGEGDEVIVPSLTFCASVQAIAALRAKPVFCEVSPQTLHLDLADAAARITGRTRAIMPVHYCGNACDMDRLLDLGKTHGLAIVEDAAHAFGSSWRGRKLGSFGEITCFSFDPIKNITCGEGGAICTADEGLAELMRRKRVLGISRDGWNRRLSTRGDYEVSTLGYRYHMSNINAAIGLAQMDRFDEFLRRKREIVRVYNEKLSGVPGIELLAWDLEEAFPFAYMIRVPDGRRESLMDALKERGIASGVHYPPNHLQPLFCGQSLPVTERLGQEILSLPLHCDLSDADVAQVVTAIAEFFG